MADQPADGMFPANGFKRLIVQGTGYSGAASGEWYTVIGNWYLYEQGQVDAALG